MWLSTLITCPSGVAGEEAANAHGSRVKGQTISALAWTAAAWQASTSSTWTGTSGMTGAVASWVMRLIWAPGRSGSARVTIQPLVHYRPQSQYVAVETLGRLQRRTAEIRDGSANTHIVVILPSRFDAAGAAGRMGAWSVRSGPGLPRSRQRRQSGMCGGCGRVGGQIQPRERASWTASWRLAAPSLAAAEER